MGVNKRLLGHDLINSPIVRLSPGKRVHASRIVAATRIGISVAKDRPWRFYIKGNPFVSRA